jgi:hypothetical protein
LENAGGWAACWFTAKQHKKKEDEERKRAREKRKAHDELEKRYRVQEREELS